jgi:hypothetical protein
VQATIVPKQLQIREALILDETRKAAAVCKRYLPS